MTKIIFLCTDCQNDCQHRNVNIVASCRNPLKQENQLIESLFELHKDDNLYTDKDRMKSENFDKIDSLGKGHFAEKMEFLRRQK